MDTQSIDFKGDLWKKILASTFAKVISHFIPVFPCFQELKRKIQKWETEDLSGAKRLR